MITHFQLTIRYFHSNFLEHQTKFDEERPATSHKYGKSTIIPPASNLNDQIWTSTNRLVYRAPAQRSKAHVRQAHASLDVLFDNAMTSSNRPTTKASGFGTSMTTFDGPGWEPDRVLHTDQIRTSYRNEFCKAKPFHKVALKVSSGRIPRKQVVFDKKDFRKIKLANVKTSGGTINQYYI